MGRESGGCFEESGLRGAELGRALSGTRGV